VRRPCGWEGLFAGSSCATVRLLGCARALPSVLGCFGHPRPLPRPRAHTGKESWAKLFRRMQEAAHAQAALDVMCADVKVRPMDAAWWLLLLWFQSHAGLSCPAVSQALTPSPCACDAPVWCARVVCTACKHGMHVMRTACGQDQAEAAGPCLLLLVSLLQFAFAGPGGPGLGLAARGVWTDGAGPHWGAFVLYDGDCYKGGRKGRNLKDLAAHLAAQEKNLGTLNCVYAQCGGGSGSTPCFGRAHRLSACVMCFGFPRTKRWKACDASACTCAMHCWVTVPHLVRGTRALWTWCCSTQSAHATTAIPAGSGARGRSRAHGARDRAGPTAPCEHRWGLGTARGRAASQQAAPCHALHLGSSCTPEGGQCCCSLARKQASTHVQFPRRTCTPLPLSCLCQMQAPRPLWGLRCGGWLTCARRRRCCWSYLRRSTACRVGGAACLSLVGSAPPSLFEIVPIESPHFQELQLASSHAPIWGGAQHGGWGEWPSSPAWKCFLPTLELPIPHSGRGREHTHTHTYICVDTRSHARAQGRTRTWRRRWCAGATRLRATCGRSRASCRWWGGLGALWIQLLVGEGLVLRSLKLRATKQRHSQHAASGSVAQQETLLHSLTRLLQLCIAAGGCGGGADEGGAGWGPWPLAEGEGVATEAGLTICDSRSCLQCYQRQYFFFIICASSSSDQRMKGPQAQAVIDSGGSKKKQTSTR